MPGFHLPHLLLSLALIGYLTVRFTCTAFSQEDSLSQIPGYIQDQIETLLSDSESEADFDFNDLGEAFRYHLTHPLHINRASEGDLEALNLLNDIQIADFLHYRDELGALESIQELQAIPSFDLNTIERILPFITIEDDRIFDGRSFSKMLIRGRNELYLRSSRVLEQQQGYRSIDNQPPKYLGNQNQYYVRFKHQFEQNLSYGFTLEKDPGEPFFNDVNKNGFDYSNFHLFVRNLNQVVHTVAIGDYSVSLGQGLIMHSGYGGGKSSFVTKIKRGGRTLRPYTSVNEAAALRGVATTFNLNPISITVFASRRKQDGNVLVDSSDGPESIQSFSSLQISGLHRTTNEIEDKRAIQHQVIGTRLHFKKRSVAIGLNALNNHFDQPFERNLLPYNRFYFRGSSLSNASLDYGYRFRNFNFFGEIAASDNGAIGQTHGLLMGLSRYVDLALLYRNLAPRYQALQATPFIESSQANNEKGIYVGSEIKINPSFWISVYADYWSHPWLRFNADAPSNGKEHFIRLTYYKKRRLEAYLQIRSESKAINFRTDVDHVNRIGLRDRKNIRFHLSQKVHQNLELRNRIEFSKVDLAGGPESNGFLIYQDIIYKSIKLPLSFTTRLCYFDTDDYSSRIYAYENDILYSFSIPAFFNEGLRYYLNLRYRFRNFTLEARMEQTRYRNQETISSGGEEITGNKRTRIKLQCRFAF
ncbi:MAG: helix-hairpin-helix domain-containing protein [Saprospiraceae bacterium]|nr:helix-hairpin-helix domain-containing protein [Saprospiraceae bacterium]